MTLAVFLKRQHGHVESAADSVRSKETILGGGGGGGTTELPLDLFPFQPAVYINASEVQKTATKDKRKADIAALTIKISEQKLKVASIKAGLKAKQEAAPEAETDDGEISDAVAEKQLELDVTKAEHERLKAKKRGNEKNLKTCEKLDCEIATKQEYAETEQALAEDEKYLAELREMCKTKTAEFESRQALRQAQSE